MDCFGSVRADLESLEENCNVKGDPEKLVVRFNTYLSEVEIRDYLAKLSETNEHLKGYEILSINPPKSSGKAATESNEGAVPNG